MKLRKSGEHYSTHSRTLIMTEHNYPLKHESPSRESRRQFNAEWFALDIGFTYVRLA